MRISFFATFALLVAGTPHFAFGDSDDFKKNLPTQSIEALINAVEEHLPNGWVVTYEKEFCWLEIKRTERERLVSTAPNLGWSGKPLDNMDKQQHMIAFRALHLISPQNYRQVKRETEAKMLPLYEKLSHSHSVNRKFEEFESNAAKERIEIAEYNRLRDAWNQLPDFYFQNISLKWGWHDRMVPKDEPTFHQYQEIEKSITSVFSTY